jgi:large subunit ribosomal protein L35
LTFLTLLSCRLRKIALTKTALSIIIPTLYRKSPKGPPEASHTLKAISSEKNSAHAKEFSMPKMKSNRSAFKRFKATGTGKVKRNKAYARHILTTKTTKQKRGLRSPAIVDHSNMRSIKKLLPYIGI